MYRFLVIIFLIFPILGFSQEKLNFQKTDSISYQYYMNGEWKKLIELTKDAFKQNIDSKFMRQRAGYAYFMSGDYTAAGIQFKRALAFDMTDEFTREYIYYAALNTAGENARLYAENLPGEAATKLGIKKFIPIGMIDTEFNIKTNQVNNRSNQIYYRFGINTDFGFRLSLYQAYAYYEQTFSGELTRQPEYFALLKWSLSPDWHVRAAYHRLFTTDANVSYPGNLGYTALASQVNRFNFEINMSLLKTSLATTQQAGFQASVVLPGRSNLYFTGSLIGMYENRAFRTIYSQTAGLKCAKNLWAEGNITLGNLKNYSTYSTLYIYNSIDPSVFRTGLSLIYYCGKHLTFVGNFTFDQQEILNNTTNKYFYYQYSYSGGLKWRL